MIPLPQSSPSFSLKFPLFHKLFPCQLLGLRPQGAKEGLIHCTERGLIQLEGRSFTISKITKSLMESSER